MESKNYWKKINDWHTKAKLEEDIFIKFILEYISFIAFLNMKNSTINNDRMLIEKLKNSKNIKQKYFTIIDKRIIKELKKELEFHPIKNVTRPNDKRWDGRLTSLNDFSNIIEFIYRARNNLFHGQKRLNFERDSQIVQYGYKLLNPLMEIIIEQEKSV